MKNYLLKFRRMVPALIFLALIANDFSGAAFASEITTTPSKVKSPKNSHGKSLDEFSDRLVVAVGGSSYSERHVLVWMVLRELLQEVPTTGAKQSGKELPKKSRPSYIKEMREHWAAVLAKFSEDMLIKQEASRLGSSAPSERSVVTVASRIDARRKLDRELDAAYVALHVDDQEKFQVVANILQVESFRSTRDRKRPRVAQRQNGLATGAVPGGQAAESALITELKSRYTIRFYEGAAKPGSVLEKIISAVNP